MGEGPASTHYGNGIQPLHLIESMSLGFHEANVVKYVARWRSKGGIQDLEKARFYIDRLIQLNQSPTEGAHEDGRG